jgi:hypothetical protein
MVAWRSVTVMEKVPFEGRNQGAVLPTNSSSRVSPAGTVYSFGFSSKLTAVSVAVAAVVEADWFTVGRTTPASMI